MTTTTPASPTLPPAQSRRPGAPPPVQAPSAFAAIDPMKILQQYYPWLVLAVVVGVGFGIGAFQVLRRAYPIWEAEATYEIRSVAESATDPIQASRGGREDLEAFMNTMARIATSDRILSRALEERSVRETRWAEKYMDATGSLDAVEALQKLRKIVGARAISDTNIMQLTVGTHHKDDAPNICRAISDVFLDDVGSNSSREMRDLIQQFEGVVRDLSKDIETLDARTETLLAKQELTALEQQNTVHYSEVQNLQPALVRMREQFELTKKQLESYDAMLNNPSGPVYPETIREEVERSPIVLERDATIANLRATIRAQRESFGERHREVILIQRRLDAELVERDELMKKRLLETFNALVESLRNSLTNQQASLAELEDRLTTSKDRLEETTQALNQYRDMTTERQEKIEKKSEMERNVSELRLLDARGSRVRVIAPPVLPDSLAFPKIIPTVAVSVILWTGLVGGLIALKEIREQRVRGPHDIMLIPRTRVLGVIPELSMDPSLPERVELASRDHPQGVISEAIRQLRVNLLKDMISKGHKSLLVVGGLPGSGASSLISNLAYNAAATDLRVLIVDANLRRPAMHTIFGLSDAPGLADLVLGNSTIDQSIRATTIRNISILACGSRGTPVFERFTTPAVHALFAQFRDRFDLVLVDSTPGVVAGDAVVLASHCDAVMLVTRAFSEKRGLVARLRNQLGDTSAEFMGVVVNAVKHSAGGYFKRNYQVTHEYGRGGEETTAKAKDKNGKNGTPDEPSADADKAT